MNTINWYYLRNVFDNVTKFNFKRMMILSKDHIDKLSHAANSDTQLVPLLNALKPAYQGFFDQYQKTQIVAQRREMFTAQLVKALGEIPAVVEEWDYKIIEKYRPKTSEYQYLMNEGRTVFQRGGYDMRLQAVHVLIQKLAEFPVLSNVYTEVKNWYDSTMTIRQTQQGFEGELQQAQSQLETTRQELSKQMQYVWAGLIMRYIDDVQRVENFYELKYLQRGTNTEESIEPAESEANTTVLQAAEKKVLLEKEFTPTTNIELKNTKNTSLAVWLSANKNSTKPEDALIIGSGSVLSVLGDELSDGSTPLNYLLAENMSIDAEGGLSVRLEE